MAQVIRLLRFTTSPDHALARRQSISRMQLTQGLHRCRDLFPNRAATICAGRTKTWATLVDRIARLAGGFQKIGVMPGDRVVILSLNSDYFVEALYAAAWVGAVFVPFNTRWAKAEIEHAVNDCEPRIALLDDTFASHTEAFSARGVKVLHMEQTHGADSLECLIQSSPPADDRRKKGETLAGIFYTGGTTGRSKGVKLSHRNILSSFFSLHAIALYPSETIFLHTPPMFHLADAGLLFGLTQLGATHVILPGFEPGSTLRAIEQHRVSALVLVPTMIGMLCEALRDAAVDLSSVGMLSYGASPISSAVLERAMAAFPNARFVQGYGQTELSPAATVLDHADHLAGRLQSAGRAIPGVDVRIVNESMAELERGAIGEIVVRGANVMLGYWRQPELTAKTIVNDWLRTGDAGYLDVDGYLYLVDRVKDMIVSGGENVYSAEVEDALMRHPSIMQCAVIGVPDDRWGERVHAVLYLRPGAKLDEADLIAHCEPLIANYKRPRSFELRDSPLPLSGVGKILKTELRKPYWQDRSRNVG
ncbi:MAG: long-chain fatty acid--CoA ligase [Hyphomonadaceae bacterium]|nr:long-chain fatty acid--CoA ligase [Hyphomonadaceae bacterium]